MKKQKKVLFVATVASHIKSFHLPYLKILQENGYKTYVAANWNIPDEDKLKYCDKFIQIPIQRSPYSLKNLKAIKELKIIIDKEQFDIIHCHTPMGSVVARLAAKKARKKYGTRVIYTAHGFHFFTGAPLKNWLLFYPVEWYLSKYTDTLITINQEDYNRAKNKFSKRCKDIQYVPGVGIDTKKFDFKMTKKEKKELRESLDLKEDDFVLIFPARLDKNKNQGFLINAMEELVKDHSNIHLLLPGRDERNGYYQKMTKEKKLDNNIHFLGHRKDIHQLMKISDIAVSSSLREGLPVNVMEALATRKPVIALKCRGMEDLICDGVNGYLVDLLSDNKEQQFAELIIKTKNYPLTISNQCQLYSIDEIMTKMINIYFDE